MTTSGPIRTHFELLVNDFNERVTVGVYDIWQVPSTGQMVTLGEQRKRYLVVDIRWELETHFEPFLGANKTQQQAFVDVKGPYGTP